MSTLLEPWGWENWVVQLRRVEDNHDTQLVMTLNQWTSMNVCALLPVKVKLYGPRHGLSERTR